jgi:hypothetical protein
VTGISDEDLTTIESSRLQGKPRPKGTLPYLPKTDDVEVLREFLSLAFAPRPGWRVWDFSRAGRQKADPCSVVLRNGRETVTFRFNHQAELWGRDMRAIVLAVTEGKLRPPHLTGGEVEDVWAALCILGTVTSEYDELSETHKWIEQLLPVTTPLMGHTLVPDGRHDGLMALKAMGEFTRPDALQLLRGGEGQQWQRRPVRFVDKQTGDHYLRAGETAAFVRYVLGAEPLSHSALRARLSEIGVHAKLFEDYRPPHPKLTLYALTPGLTEQAQEAK